MTSIKLLLSGLVVLLLMTMNLQAQNDTTSTKKGWGWEQRGDFISFGLQFPKLDKLNTLLENNDYATLTEQYFPIGYGFIGSSGNFVTQFEIYFNNDNNSNEKSSTELFYWGWNVSFGYDFIKNEKFNLYPLAGLSFDWTTIQITDDLSNKTQFNNYISSIGNQIEIKNVNINSHLAGQFNFLPKIKKESEHRLIVGIRSGYLLPLFETIWLMNDIQLEDGPKINPGGLYVKLILGFML